MTDRPSSDRVEGPDIAPRDNAAGPPGSSLGDMTSKANGSAAKAERNDTTVADEVSLDDDPRPAVHLPIVGTVARRQAGGGP